MSSIRYPIIISLNKQSRIINSHTSSIFLIRSRTASDDVDNDRRFADSGVLVLPAGTTAADVAAGSRLVACCTFGSCNDSSLDAASFFVVDDGAFMSFSIDGDGLMRGLP